MPFRIDLMKMQRPKIWTSSSETPAARRLQELYNQEDSEGYKQLLAELRSEFITEKGNDERQKHDFRLTDGKVYEIWDRGVTQTTSIQFMVKGSVITWSFLASKDETHQTWRDKVFNTAAIAHQSVEHGCETYYRGSNAYHLKKMHSHRGEYDYNHNHYRLKEDRPITPKEVEEHLRAFYNQTNGKEFIPDEMEVDSIIGKYKIYWAEYELDPRYSKYYPLVDGGKRSVLFDEIFASTSDKTLAQALNKFCTKIGISRDLVRGAYIDLIAKAKALGALAPLDLPKLKTAMEYAASREFKSPEAILEFAQYHGLTKASQYVDFIAAFNEFNSKVYFAHDFKVIKGKNLPDDLEVDENDEYLHYPSLDIKKTHLKSGSPREQYNNAIDQMMNWDDAVEFKLFSEALTNRCRSIDDTMLGELRPEDFRKALRLYNAMKHLNNGKITVDEAIKQFSIESVQGRFSEELFAQVLSMQSEIAGMVSVEEDPGPALSPIFAWIKTAKPELEDWLTWVETNGSRGLGAEIAYTREQDGGKITRHSFFREMDDRKPGSGVANVLSLKPKSERAEDQLAFKVRTYLQSIMHLMGEEVYVHKSKVADVLIDILEGKKTYDTLEPAIEEFSQWNRTEEVDPLIKGVLTSLVAETQELKAPKTPIYV